MTKENTYNGWANRETWLVGLYFGELLQNQVEELVLEDEEIEEGHYNKFGIADQLKETVESYLEEELNALSSFLSDFIDLSRIEWLELAENYLSEVTYNK